MIIHWWWNCVLISKCNSGRSLARNELDLSSKKKKQEVDCLMQQWALCHEKKSYHSNTKTCVSTQTDRERGAHNQAWFFIYSLPLKMDCTNVLSFSPVSKRFTSVCGVTRSLEMALAPSSQGRNHLAEWQTHTYIHAQTHTQHREAGRIWIALRQTFLTQVLYSSTRSSFCPEHTLTHIQKYLHWDSILSAFSPRSCNDKRCCPAVKHCQ